MSAASLTPIHSAAVDFSPGTSRRWSRDQRGTRATDQDLGRTSSCSRRLAEVFPASNHRGNSTLPVEAGRRSPPRAWISTAVVVCSARASACSRSHVSLAYPESIPDDVEPPPTLRSHTLGQTEIGDHGR